MKKYIITIIAMLYAFPFNHILWAADHTWTQRIDFAGTTEHVIFVPDNAWMQKAYVGGAGRNAAVGFSIGDKGYVGTGNAGVFQQDFWEYDPVADTWTQKADFGGGARIAAVAFSIGNRGYVGTGWDASYVYRKDFWEFDPVLNAWTRKADFGGSGRIYAAGFSIGSKGYIGTGADKSSPTKDFWEYNPAADVWKQKADCGGTGREYAVGFSIGNKGYIGTGNRYGIYHRDFWEYDPVADAWKQKADFGGTGRVYAVGFSIGGRGYIGTGYDKSNDTKDFWEYDPAADTWTQKTDFGGTARNCAVGFSIGNKGYVGTGNDGLSNKKDFWEYSTSAAAASLYFPHIATGNPWQTEIAIVNTGDQIVTGTLRGLSHAGELVETQDVTLAAHGRREISVANGFTNHAGMGYITFNSDSSDIQGYTKFYIVGQYRAAIPAVKQVNASNIYVSHIALDDAWWTGISLVNTTSTRKVLTITFNNGQSRQITLNANEHRAFNIAGDFFSNQPPPDVQSAVITNASGVIGLELFGSLGWGNQLEGIPLSDNTALTLYYPHVAGGEWWTGIVAYNPSDQACKITIRPYSAVGSALADSTFSIAGGRKYIGAVSTLDLPAQTAWFRIDATNPLSGFELFGTTQGNQLGAYAGAGTTAAKAGIFAKIEKNGWTGIAFVNTEASVATVTLRAYDDNGHTVAAEVISVAGHAKVVNPPQDIFSQNIGSATYIAFTSDRNVVGFQLNGSSDGTMLDGLPAM